MGAGSRREGLSPGQRLRQASDFQRVLRQGRRADGALLTLVALSQGPVIARLGLAVSRRAGNAVQRNRTKRLMREVFRHHKLTGFDIVALPKAGMAQATLSAVNQQFEKLMRRFEASPRDRRETRPAAAH